MKSRIILIDNYDSFTFNVYHSLIQAGAHADVISNDDPGLLLKLGKYDALVISPGPSRPSNSGLSAEAVGQCLNKIPVLGICLGMQIINEIYGGETVKAPYPVHGKASQITRTGQSKLLEGLLDNFIAARYHSLICSNIQHPMRVTAQEDKIPMAIEHDQAPVYGVQFHPESFLTTNGQQIINNFVSLI